MYKKQILLGTLNKKQIVFFLQCPSHKPKIYISNILLIPMLFVLCTFPDRNVTRITKTCGWATLSQSSAPTARLSIKTPLNIISPVTTLPTQAKHARKNKATSCGMSWTQQCDLSRSFCSSRRGTGWMTSSPFRAIRDLRRQQESATELLGHDRSHDLFHDVHARDLGSRWDARNLVLVSPPLGKLPEDGNSLPWRHWCVL